MPARSIPRRRLAALLGWKLFRAPDAHGWVGAGRRDPPALGVEGNGLHAPAVARQRQHFLARLDVPDINTAVCGGQDSCEHDRSILNVAARVRLRTVAAHGSSPRAR